MAARAKKWLVVVRENRVLFLSVMLFVPLNLMLLYTASARFFVVYGAAGVAAMTVLVFVRRWRSSRAVSLPAE